MKRKYAVRGRFGAALSFGNLIFLFLRDEDWGGEIVGLGLRSRPRLGLARMFRLMDSRSGSLLARAGGDKGSMGEGEYGERGGSMEGEECSGGDETGGESSSPPVLLTGVPHISHDVDSARLRNVHVAQLHFRLSRSSLNGENMDEITGSLGDVRSRTCDGDVGGDPGGVRGGDPGGVRGESGFTKHRPLPGSTFVTVPSSPSGDFGVVKLLAWTRLPTGKSIVAGASLVDFGGFGLLEEDEVDASPAVSEGFCGDGGGARNRPLLTAPTSCSMPLHRPTHFFEHCGHFFLMTARA